MNNYTVLVTGARRFTDQQDVCSVLDEVLLGARLMRRPLVIRHGDCPRGVDRFTHLWCQEHPEVIEERFPAAWDKHGKRAGFLRNTHMASLGADLCIGFISGASNGTKHCITEAKRFGILTLIIEEKTHMAIDPFAVADEAQTEPVTEEAPKPAPRPDVSAPTDGKVTLTFKCGGGFADPWIVIHAADLDDALDQVSDDNAVTLSQLMTGVAKAAKHFAGLSISDKATPRPAGGGAPAASGHQQPPAGFPPLPDGWKYVTKIGKNGKPWHGYNDPSGKLHFINKQKDGSYVLAD